MHRLNSDDHRLCGGRTGIFLTTLLLGIVAGLSLTSLAAAQGAFSVSTTISGSGAWDGCMFNVEAINTITVYRVGVQRSTTGTATVGVYYRPDGFAAPAAGGWVHAGDASVTFTSTNSIFEVPVDLLLILNPGELLGIAVVRVGGGGYSGGLRYESVGLGTFSDANMHLHSDGNGVQWTGTGSPPWTIPWNGRSWHGTVWYDVGTPGPDILSPGAGALTVATEGQTGWSETFECDGGTSPYDWSLSGAPGWLGFNPTAGATVALESATVGSAGSYAFDVTVTDANGEDDMESYTLDVNPPPVISGPPSYAPITETGMWGSAPPISVSGGTDPITWSATGLPAGMTINATTGVIGGAPDAATSGGSPYSVTVTAEDANGVSDTFGPLDLVVNGPPIVTSGVMPLAPLTLPYSETLQAAGGTPPYTWATAGLLGPFLVDANTGEITGTPATVATFSFDVTVTDACGVQATATISIETGEPPEVQDPMWNALTETGAVPADTMLVATGGFPDSFTWTYSGTLPPGLSLAEVTLVGGEVAYLLSGAPPAGSVGVYAVDVTVTDTYQGLADTFGLVLTVNPPPVVDIQAGTTLPSATLTGPWSHICAVVAGTGTAPFVWEIGTVSGAAASLEGFAFAANALETLSAIGPAGEYSVEILVTDANGVVGAQVFAFTIAPMPTLTAPVPAREGELFSAMVEVEAGTGVAPFAYTILTNLPLETGLTVGLTVDGVPAIEGLAAMNGQGNYTCEINVIDANGVSVTETVAVVILAKPTASSCCGATAGQPRHAGWWLLLLATLVPALARRRS